MLQLRLVGLVLFCVLYLSVEVSGQGVLVNTTYGTLRGLTGTLFDGRQYEAFLGVPFAAPPIGDLRWEKPVAPSSWEGVRNATQFGPHCTSIVAWLYPLIGMSREISEDCLYLNVYVPGSVDDIGPDVLPVMVYYYGGGFQLGTAEMYPGEHLAVEGQVIVVTVNYRVGALGFLSTEDDAAPGNYGIWDGLAALQWVQDNIQNFGGDKDRVTIFGQSAGGTAVSHMALSPEASGLFHRVIALSGSASVWFGEAIRAEQTAKNIGLVNFCPLLNNERMVNCLREENAGKLDVLGYLIPVIFYQITPLSPLTVVIDGDLLSADPREVMMEGSVNEYDLMTGYCHHDFAGIIYVNPLGFPLIDQFINLAKTQNSTDDAVEMLFGYLDNPDEVITQIKLQYPDLENPDVDTRTRAATQMATDFTFASPSLFEAEHHASTSTNRSTYVYDFSYRQSFLGYADWVNGSHVDDIYSVFGYPFMKTWRDRFLRKDFTDPDFAVSQYIMHYYSNFAYTGNPNSGPHTVPAEWPQYSSSTDEYMLFGFDPQSSTHDTDLQDRVYWWNNVFPQIAEVPEYKSLDFSESKMKMFREILPLLEKLDMENWSTMEDLLRKVFDIIGI